MSNKTLIRSISNYYILFNLMSHAKTETAPQTNLAKTEGDCHHQMTRCFYIYYRRVGNKVIICDDKDVTD